MGVKLLSLSAACILAADSAFAQTVQLPTIQTFSVDTSVLVPDGGRASLGGITRARSGSTTRGVPGISNVPFANRLTQNRGLGLERSTSNAYVTATIIDHAELDRQVRAQATRPAPRTEHQVSVQRRADFLAQHLARPAAEQRPHDALANQPSISAELKRIRQKNELAQSNRRAQTMRYINKGKAAERVGKLSLARTYYKMAAKDASENVRRQLIARIQFLANPAPTQLVHQ